MDLTGAPICVDKASGAISNATPVEHAGLVLTRMAAKALRPLDDLGFSHAARLIRCLLPSRRKVAVRFTQDMTFCFPYGDGYWGLLLDPRDTYEEEVEALLLAVKDCEYAFIDCGANYGYWSLKVTSERFGRHKAAAIELDPASFALLEANVAANGGRVTCLNRAVAGRDDDVLRFYGAKHEARSVVPQAGVEPKGEVLSVTLDRLVDDGHIPQEGPLVLKLDVEGIEIEALRGGVALLMRDVLVIYEEHGSDRSHAVSRYLREDCGMRLFGHAGHDFFELGPLGELDRIKTNRRRGYDFFATRSRFWLDRLESLARGWGQGRTGVAAAHRARNGEKDHGGSQTCR